MVREATPHTNLVLASLTLAVVRVGPGEQGVGLLLYLVLEALTIERAAGERTISAGELADLHLVAFARNYLRALLEQLGTKPRSFSHFLRMILRFCYLNRPIPNLMSNLLFTFSPLHDGLRARLGTLGAPSAVGICLNLLVEQELFVFVNCVKILVLLHESRHTFINVEFWLETRL